FGVIILISGLVTINPIWIFGPYTPDQVSAGSQPDWYIGWLDGALRITPNWETSLWGYTISWNIFLPAVILPGIVFTAAALYPFIEAWATGDKRDQNLLDRPRNAPTRTAIGVMAITFYFLLFIGGGNDIIAITFDLSINSIIWFLRIAIFVLPPIAFVVTRRICIALQRRDREKLLHGYESGRILRLPHGEYIEVHEPLPAKELAVLESAIEAYRTPLPAPQKVDANGVRNKHYRIKLLRSKLSHWYYADDVKPPTRLEIEEGQAHVTHDAALEAPLHEYEETHFVNVPFHGGILHEEGAPMSNKEQLEERGGNL
ncbi:MAG: hypothetical protein ACKOMX_11650, partial [Actinomycetota bacterium]